MTEKVKNKKGKKEKSRQSISGDRNYSQYGTGEHGGCGKI